MDPLLISFFQDHGEYGFIKNKIEDKENQELKNNYEEIKVFSSWSVYLGDNKDKSWNDGPPFIRNVTDRNE